MSEYNLASDNDGVCLENQLNTDSIQLVSPKPPQTNSDQPGSPPSSMVGSNHCVADTGAGRRGMNLLWLSVVFNSVNIIITTPLGGVTRYRRHAGTSRCQ